MERDLTQRQGMGERMRANAAWFGLLCQVLEASVVVFTRSRFGRRYFGMQAAAVIPLVLLYSLFWRDRDPTPLMVFLGLYLVAWGIARAGIVRRGLRGDREHSYYSGAPSILRWPVFRRWLSERRAKLSVEPLLIAAWGVGLMPVSEPLGCYLMLAAFGSAMSMRIACAYERTRLADMQDQYIEQRQLAERFRDGGWR